jgi:hypothetical protein
LRQPGTFSCRAENLKKQSVLGGVNRLFHRVSRTQRNQGSSLISNSPK